MGTDNGKSSRMTSARRIKKKSPPPPPDAMSVSSQSTEDATNSVSGNSHASSRHIGQGSVASSASSKDSIMKASVLYKEMAGKRRRAARKDPSSSRSSGGGMIRKASLVICAMFLWVLFYFITTYSDQFHGLIISFTGAVDGGEESGETPAPRWKSDTVKATEGTEQDGSKIEREKKEDADAQLASLSSGAGTTLWEGVLQGDTTISGESTSDAITSSVLDGTTAAAGDESLATPADSGANEARLVTATTDSTLSSNSKLGMEVLEGATNSALPTSLNASFSELGAMIGGQDTLASLSSLDRASLTSVGTAPELSGGDAVAQGLSSASTETGQLSSDAIADGTTSEAASTMGAQTTLSTGQVSGSNRNGAQEQNAMDKGDLTQTQQQLGGGQAPIAGQVTANMNGAQEHTTMERGDLTQTQQQFEGGQAPIARQVTGFKTNGVQDKTTGLLAKTRIGQQTSEIAQQPILDQVKGYPANGDDGKGSNTQLFSQNQQLLGGNQLVSGTLHEGTDGQRLTPEGALNQQQMPSDVQGLTNTGMPSSNLGYQVQGIGELSEAQEMTPGPQTNNAMQNSAISQSVDQTTKEMASGSQRKSILEANGAQDRMAIGETLNQASDARSVGQTDVANSRGSLEGSMLNEQASLGAADTTDSLVSPEGGGVTNPQASLRGSLNEQALEDSSQGVLRGTNTLESSSAQASRITSGDQAMLRGSPQQMDGVQQSQLGLVADALADNSDVTVEQMHQMLGDSPLSSQGLASSNKLNAMQGTIAGNNLIDSQSELTISNNADRTLDDEDAAMQQGSNSLMTRSSDAASASTMNQEQGASMFSGDKRFMVVNKKLLAHGNTNSNINDNELTSSQSVDQSGGMSTRGGVVLAQSSNGENSMALQSNDGSGMIQQNSDGAMTQTSNMASERSQQTQLPGGGRIPQSDATVMDTARGGSQGSMSRNTVGSSSLGMPSLMQSQEMNRSTQQQGEMPIQSSMSEQQGLTSRQAMQLQPSRLRRRLQDQSIVEESRKVTETGASYESMSPPALTEYVANHVHYRNLLNFDEDLPFDPSSQVPYFWHIHKSGGSSMKHMLQCMGLAQTRRGSDPACNDTANYIHVCPLVWGTAINADASSPQGIERIKRLGLFNLNATNLVVTTSRIYEALSIFNPQHRGRLFVLLRDPVERAISKFFYTQVATWERNYKPELANMSLVDFTLSHHCYDNWMTRRLVHKMDPQLQLVEGDLRLAKEIIRQKALLLLTSNMGQSAVRMNQYFGWNLTGDQRFCIEQYSHRQHINKNPHPIPAKDSPEWAAIRDKNLLDVELYRYALALYHDQQGPFLHEMFGPLRLREAANPHYGEHATPDEKM